MKNGVLVHLQVSFIAMNYSFTMSLAPRIQERGLTKLTKRIATRLNITLAPMCHWSVVSLHTWKLGQFLQGHSIGVSYVCNVSMALTDSPQNQTFNDAP
jgi:hypothetical protein